MKDITKINSTLPSFNRSADIQSSFRTDIKAGFLTPNAEEVSGFLKYKDHYIVCGQDGCIIVYDLYFKKTINIKNGDAGIWNIFLHNDRIFVYTSNTVSIYKIDPPDSWESSTVYYSDDEIITLQQKGKSFYILKKEKKYLEEFSFSKNALIKKGEIDFSIFTKNSPVTDFYITDDKKLIIRISNEIIVLDRKCKSEISRVISKEINPGFAYKKNCLAYTNDGEVKVLFLDTGNIIPVYKDDEFYPRLLYFFNNDQNLAIGSYCSVTILSPGFKKIFRADYILHNNTPGAFYFDREIGSLFSCHDEIAVISGIISKEDGCFKPENSFRIENTAAENAIKAYSSPDSGNIIWTGESGIINLIDIKNLALKSIPFDLSYNPEWITSVTENQAAYFLAGSEGIKIVDKKTNTLKTLADLTAARICKIADIMGEDLLLVSSYDSVKFLKLSGEKIFSITLSLLDGCSFRKTRDAHLRLISVLPGQNKINLLLVTKSNRIIILKIGKNKKGYSVEKSSIKEIQFPEKSSAILTACSFSHKDNNYLILGINTKSVAFQLYKIEDDSITPLTKLSSSSSISAIYHIDGRIILGNGVGDILEYNIETGDLKKKLKVKNYFIVDILPLPENRLAIAAADEIWIINTNYNVLGKIKILKKTIIFFSERNESLIYYNPLSPDDPYQKDHIFFTRENKIVRDDKEILEHLKLFLGSHAVKSKRYGYDDLWKSLNISLPVSDITSSLLHEDHSPLIEYKPVK